MHQGTSDVEAATRDELLELLRSMAAEAAKPEAERPRATLRTLADGFSARVKDIQTVHQVWLAVQPLFEALFG